MIYLWDGPNPPFVDLLRPIGERTVANLQQSFSDAPLSAQAWTDISDECINWIAQITATSLYLRFHAFRVVAAPSKAIYKRFVTSVDARELAELVDGDSDVAFIVRSALADWTEATESMLCRILGDGPELVSAFKGLAVEFPVVRIFGRLSEYHRGATVRRLQFSNGTSLMYKPRDCTLDAWWAWLTHWLREHVSLAEVRSAKVWCRNDYGWCEEIAETAVKDLADLHRYYRRAGHLLCWLWFTHTRDAVRSNLIAAGSWPILVDAETALYPVSPLPLRGSSPFEVLETGLLPRVGAEGSAGSVTSGLCLDPEISREVRLCVDGNTDNMRLERRSIPAPGESSVPQFAGVRYGARGFVSDIAVGFREAYQHAAEGRATLLARNSPLSQTTALSGRFAFRPSIFYGELLHQNLLAASGQPVTAIATLLERSALHVSMTKTSRQCLQSYEQAELSRASMPRFGRTADTLEVRPLGLFLDGWIPGDRATRARLETLDAVTLEEQLQKIADSFRS